MKIGCIVGLGFVFAVSFFVISCGSSEVPSLSRPQSITAVTTAGGVLNQAVLFAGYDARFPYANCVFLTEQNKTRNLTYRGGLSQGQLRYALSYTSYPMHFLTGFIPGSIGLVGAFNGEALSPILAMTGVAVLSPSLVGRILGYRALFTVAISSSIAEFILRGMRYEDVHSLATVHQVDSNQLTKFIKKILETEPAYPGACVLPPATV